MTTPDAGPHAGPDPDGRLARAVEAAQTALIEFEVAVETFRIEVANFSRLHEQRLGPLYARLEELDARIAEATAARTGDPADQARAREARARVTPLPSIDDLFGAPRDDRADGGTDTGRDGGGSADDGARPGSRQSTEPPPKVRPGPEARALYRDLVRRCHPDLASDAPERAHRDTFIARVNEAYARGDADALRALAAEWEETGGQPRPPGVDELTARLEWLARRKELLAETVAALEGSAIGSMLRLAPDDPDGLLDQIAADLHRTLADREARLAALLAPTGAGEAPPQR